MCRIAEMGMEFRECLQGQQYYKTLIWHARSVEMKHKELWEINRGRRTMLG